MPILAEIGPWPSVGRIGQNVVAGAWKLRSVELDRALAKLDQSLAKLGRL